MVNWLENLQVEQTNALCYDIEGHKIISKCLFCNIFVGVFAFAHNIGRQFGGIATYLCTETLVETIESGPLCITDSLQNLLQYGFRLSYFAMDDPVYNTISAYRFTSFVYRRCC